MQRCVKGNREVTLRVLRGEAAGLGLQGNSLCGIYLEPRGRWKEGPARDWQAGRACPLKGTLGCLVLPGSTAGTS